MSDTNMNYDIIKKSVNIVNDTDVEKMKEIINYDIEEFTTEKLIEKYYNKIIEFITESKLSFERLQSIMDSILLEDENIGLIINLEDTVDRMLSNPYIQTIKNSLLSYDDIPLYNTVVDGTVNEKLEYINAIMNWSDSEIPNILTNINYLYNEHYRISNDVSGDSVLYKDKLNEIKEVLSEFNYWINSLYGNHEHNLIQYYLQSVGAPEGYDVENLTEEQKVDLINLTLSWAVPLTDYANIQSIIDNLLFNNFSVQAYVQNHSDLPIGTIIDKINAIKLTLVNQSDTINELELEIVRLNDIISNLTYAGSEGH